MAAAAHLDDQIMKMRTTNSISRKHIHRKYRWRACLDSCTRVGWCRGRGVGDGGWWMGVAGEGYGVGERDGGEEGREGGSEGPRMKLSR